MKGQIRGKQGAGTRLGRITPFGCKKTVVGGLVGDTAGDALNRQTSLSDSSSTLHANWDEAIDVDSPIDG
jgi:hypothetical protein